MNSIRLNRKKVNPGNPTFTGNQFMDKISAQLFSYNSNSITEQDNYSIADFKGFKQDNSSHWLNLHGIHEIETIKDVCKTLKIHDLTIQDILDINQRPKFQEFNNYWFFSLKSILPGSEKTIEQEQISFVLSDNYLISFQEKNADYFNHVRERLRNKIGIVRDRGTDYLLFLLLEAILDNYYKTIANTENNIEDLDILKLDKDPSPEIIKSIEYFKRQLHQIKKAVIPIKEFSGRPEIENLAFIKENNVKYFLELKDISLALMDECEKMEIKLDSIANLYFSIQGHRMNQVMKTLTIVATIFIPLTFIAGIYGMNFSNMPELNWKWGYFGVWILMLIVLITMIRYFKKKKWF